MQDLVGMWNAGVRLDGLGDLGLGGGRIRWFEWFGFGRG